MALFSLLPSACANGPAQKSGATFVGGWQRGPEHYSATLRAYLIDSNGNESNRLDYVHPLRRRLRPAPEAFRSSPI